MKVRLGLFLALWVSFFVLPTYAQTKVFVAASLLDLSNVLGEQLAPADFVIVGGASSTLARQIKAGAPADIFISANKEWAEFVADGRALVPVISNRLVLVSSDETTVSDIAQLPVLLDGKRLAIADPSHVPAGQYAKQALMQLDVWAAVERALAPTDNVRAAAHLVRSNAVRFGVVYASDAKALDLHVAYVFPQESHDKIQYWATLLDTENAHAVAFLEQFMSEETQAEIERFGFEPLGKHQ